VGVGVRLVAVRSIRVRCQEDGRMSVMLVKVEADRLQYHDVVVVDKLRRQVRNVERCLAFPSSLHLVWEGHSGVLCVRTNETMQVSKVEVR